MLYWHHCHPDVRDCDLGAQEGLGLLGTGYPAPCGPEPLDLELPVGAEVPSHCHPLGPGLVFQDLFFFACSILA